MRVGACPSVGLLVVQFTKISASSTKVAPTVCSEALEISFASFAWAKLPTVRHKAGSAGLGTSSPGGVSPTCRERRRMRDSNKAHRAGSATT